MIYFWILIDLSLKRYLIGVSPSPRVTDLAVIDGMLFRNKPEKKFPIIEPFEYYNFTRYWIIKLQSSKI